MPASAQLLSRLRSNAAQQGQLVLSTPVAPSVPAPLTPTPQPSIQASLDTLDEVLNQVEAEAYRASQQLQQSVAAAVPLAIDQATNTLNPQAPTPTFKEMEQTTAPLETAAAQPVDLGGGYQIAEVEKSSELPVEVEGYLQEVIDHEEQQPQEIVIADGSIQLQPSPIATKKVVVLPITPALEAAGKHSATKYSLRWLVEWSHRLMKMFSGRIIYKPEEV